MAHCFSNLCYCTNIHIAICHLIYFFFFQNANASTMSLGSSGQHNCGSNVCLPVFCLTGLSTGAGARSGVAKPFSTYCREKNRFKEEFHWLFSQSPNFFALAVYAVLVTQENESGENRLAEISPSRIPHFFKNRAMGLCNSAGKY